MPGPSPSAVPALVAALLSSCLHDVHRVGPVAAPAPPREEPVRVLVFGDFGYRTIQQWLVARGMRRATERRPFDFAVELGDNVYRCGPDPTRPGAEACRFGEDGATVVAGTPPPADPKFDRLNEDRKKGLRGRDGGPLPIYLALGNHDIGWGGAQCLVPGLEDGEAVRRRACLSVARRTPTWTMPARHYVVDRGPVRIVVVDTNVVIADYAGFTLEQELAFVREATAPCGEARLCFLAGHHPPAAVHGYGGGARPWATRMARLVAAAGGRAEAFFGGHVHALEHLSVDGLEVFLSGSTAMGGFKRFNRRVPPHAQLRFATSAWGWAELEADARGYAVRFFDWGGDPLHCCDAARGGPCRPVECG